MNAPMRSYLPDFRIVTGLEQPQSTSTPRKIDKRALDGTPRKIEKRALDGTPRKIEKRALDGEISDGKDETIRELRNKKIRAKKPRVN